jgi:hypothetical protein
LFTALMLIQTARGESSVCTANVGRDPLDEAFRRVRDLDLSLQEQLHTLAETQRRERPEFAAAVDRLVTRLRHYGAGEAAPRIGDTMPSFVLPDETAQKVSRRNSSTGAPLR